MRVYCSGPMTGKPDLNRPAFFAAEKRLSAGGNFVINPHRISALFGTAEELARSFAIHYDLPGARVGLHFPDLIRGQDLAHAVMDADLAAVRSCNAIYLLKGWKTSRGARRELAEALKYGLEIIEEDTENI